MSFLKPKELRNIFLDNLSFEDKLIEIEDKNPFKLKIDGIINSYIFLKNISPAYFKNSPDITRIQIASSEHFTSISKSELPLHVIGYDHINETYALWDSRLIKARLNKKENISVYCRNTIQTEASKKNVFLKCILSNDEVVLVFSNKILHTVLMNSVKIFEEVQSIKFNDSVVMKYKEENSNKVSQENKEKILSYVEKGDMLSAIETYIEIKEMEGEEIDFIEASAAINNLSLSQGTE